MVRRWLIRGFFLTLLLLWAAGWAVSTRYYAWGYFYRLFGGVHPGQVGFAWYRGTSDADGWDGVLRPQSFQLVGSDFWWYRNSFIDAASTHSSFCLVGFSYELSSSSQASGPPIVGHRVGVPFWFLLVVSGAALWWAWRKTAPSLRGFPVELPPRP